MIDNPTFNAFAFEPANNAIIGIYAGAAIEVFLCSLILFSHPFFLPDIGEAAGETSTYERLPDFIKSEFGDISKKVLSKEIIRFFVNAIAQKSGSCSFPHCLEPQTVSRRALALFVAIRAVYFIYLHELAHVLLGHCRFLSSRFGIKEFPELNASIKKGVPLKVLHVFEMQADGFAVQMYRRWFGHVKYIGVPVRIDSSQLELLSQLASALVFWIMGSYQSPVTELFETDHPHPTIRMFNAWINDILEQQGVEGPKQFAGRSKQLEESLTQAFTRLGRNTLRNEWPIEAVKHWLMVGGLAKDEVNTELQKLARYPEGLKHAMV